MTKALFSLIFGFLLLAVPAFAQHGHGGRASHPEGGHYGHFNGDRGHHVNAEDARHFDGRHFDADFRGRWFGRGHYFAIGRPVFVNGGYRFWYGGFWFGYYDPWPLGWCYCDNVYIDYDAAEDCYFLYNPVHPGVRFRIGVVF